MQSLEAQLKEFREQNASLKAKQEEQAKLIEKVNSQLIEENEKGIEMEELKISIEKDFEQRIAEMELKSKELFEQIEKQSLATDEKDLEISRLRRENEDLNK